MSHAHHHVLFTHTYSDKRVHLGGTVEFDDDGRRRVGRVNRVHRRATVLVEDAKGRPYSDGKNYLKFYVPLDMLKLQQTA